MRTDSPDRPVVGIGGEFLAALAVRDFERLGACLAANVHFRALEASGLREAANATEATYWLRYWFEEADEFQILTASNAQMADRLHMAYCIRVRQRTDWRLVEQQAHCAVHRGLIDAMHLLCSGFRPDPGYQRGQRQLPNDNRHPPMPASDHGTGSATLTDLQGECDG